MLGPAPLLLTLLTCVLGGSIRFPDHRDYRDQRLRDKKSVDLDTEPILPCPGGESFCQDNIPDYPSTITIQDQVIAAKLIRNAIFEDPEPRTISEEEDSLKVRSSFGGPLVKESRACDNRKATVYPKKAVNIEGKYVFIVNDNKYRQAVSIEQCLGEGEQCLNDSDAPGPSTVCRQKYATYRMYVINEAGEQVYDSFSLPSACLCHHKSDFAIRNSFRTPPDSPPLPVCPAAQKLAVTSAQLPRPEAEQPRPVSAGGGGIRFGERRRREVSVLRPAAACGPGSYCEAADTADSYPGDIVLRAVLENTELNPAIFSQLFDSGCRTAGLQGRFLIDEEQLCYGVPKVIFPRQAKNLKEEWRYIVNIENYTQSVEIEECFDHNAPFLDTSDIAPLKDEDDDSEEEEDSEEDDSDEDDSEEEQEESEEDSSEEDETVQFEAPRSAPAEFGSCLYSGAVGNNPALTSCKQLYTEHKLLALSADGQLVVDSFKLPSACACFYKEDFVLEFRRDMAEEEEEKVTTTTERVESEPELELDLPDQVEQTLQFN